MFKSLLLLMLLSWNLSQYRSCNNEGKNILIWEKNKKIKWEDFKGVQQYHPKSAAEISVQLSLEYLVNENLKSFDVICYMLKDKSWTEDTSTYGLQHEQIHFDIGEIYARRLRKAILLYKKPINRNSVTKLDSMFHYYNNLLDEEQDLYERETSHSRIRVKQEEWNNWVAKRLDSLNAYERYDIDYRWKRKIRK